jgi:hypothetical protein
VPFLGSIRAGWGSDVICANSCSGFLVASFCRLPDDRTLHSRTRASVQESIDRFTTVFESCGLDVGDRIHLYVPCNANDPSVVSHLISLCLHHRLFPARTSGLPTRNDKCLTRGLLRLVGRMSPLTLVLDKPQPWTHLGRSRRATVWTRHLDSS